MTVPKVSVVDDAGMHDIFDVVALRDGLLRVRVAYRFELGEEIRVRIDDQGELADAVAIVRAYTTDGLMELEIEGRTEARGLVSG